MDEFVLVELLLALALLVANVALEVDAREVDADVALELSSLRERVATVGTRKVLLLLLARGYLSTRDLGRRGRWVVLMYLFRLG